MSRRLVCRTAEPSALSEAVLDEMFALLSAHFYNVTHETFLSDLSRKSVVFLLHEPRTHALVGFSTQHVLETSAGDRVVFSGDTIVDPFAWGSLALAEAWGRWMLELRPAPHNRSLYWLLISKGHRTYRFLPAYFLEYAPAPSRMYTAEESAIITEVGARLFGPKLEQTAHGMFVVRHDETSQRLREHLLDSRHEEPTSPHITFFRAANPDCDQGTELVCLLNFRSENMKPFCRRMLGRPEMFTRDTEDAA